MLKFGICGLGQCGNKIADYFTYCNDIDSKIENKYICTAINSSQKDLNGLEKINTKSKIHITTEEYTDGAGKDLTIGAIIAQKNIHNIMEFLKNQYADKGINRLFFTAGLGGGTGTGTLKFAILAGLKLRFPVGLMLTIPHEKDPVFQSNAFSIIKELGELINKFKIPVFLIDNARALEHLDENKKDLLNINMKFVDEFHAFNKIASQKSPYHTLDEMDHKKMYSHSGGVMAINNLKLNAEEFFNNHNILVDQVAKAWEKNIFNKIDPSKIIQIALILEAPAKQLAHAPNRNLCEEAIKNIFGKLLNGEVNTFLGIYPITSNDNSIKVSILCSGLPLPIERIKELRDDAESGLMALKTKEDATNASFDLSDLTLDIGFKGSITSSTQDLDELFEKELTKPVNEKDDYAAKVNKYFDNI